MTLGDPQNVKQKNIPKEFDFFFERKFYHRHLRTIVQVNLGQGTDIISKNLLWCKFFEMVEKQIRRFLRGSALPTPLPKPTFQKICPWGKFFEMIKKTNSASTVVDAMFGRKIEPIEKTECIEPKFYRSYRSKAALIMPAMMAVTSY